MNCRQPCQAGILADPPRPYSLSAGAQMQLIEGCGCLFYDGFVSGLRVVVNEWVCFCVYGVGRFCEIRVGGVWRQRDGRDVTSECLTRDMRSERVRPQFATFTTCAGHSGYCYKRIPAPGVLCHRLTEVTDLPGEGTGFLQNFQKFRVRVRKSYRTSRSSWYVARACRTHRTSERV